MRQHSITGVCVLYAGLSVVSDIGRSEDIQDEKSFIRVDDHEFHLRQFHFHSPSEHTIDARHSRRRRVRRE